MNATQVKKPAPKKEKAMASINMRSFILVVAVLSAALVLCGALSYFIPQGSFLRDEGGAIIVGTYTQGEVEGIALWRVITAPVRVFASEDALTIIMISVFLLIMSGVFNLLEKTGGVRLFIRRVMSRLRDSGGHVVCAMVLLFMLFGSFFGMFEELVTLLPIVITFMLSMGMDTMTGLGACLLASCFGFCAAITNPFSVGLASEVAGVGVSDGVWLRILFFFLTYLILCLFLTRHIRRTSKNPELSPSYETDAQKREALDLDSEGACEERFFVFAIFFAAQAVVLLAIAFIRAISGYAVPILAASFLIGGIAVGFSVCEKKLLTFRYIFDGVVAMLPAVFMIALASSAKLIMAESGILDTIMNYVIDLLDGKNKFLAIILIYALIFFLQFFIGSASAKIFLVMPIVVPVTRALGLSPNVVILAYCMADGFTDVILPTNPVLLVGLSMAGISYGKWVKFTWKLQLVLLSVSLLTLFFGMAVGY